jgi:hypothetical protein
MVLADYTAGLTGMTVHIPMMLGMNCKMQELILP